MHLLVVQARGIHELVQCLVNVAAWETTWRSARACRRWSGSMDFLPRPLLPSAILSWCLVMLLLLASVIVPSVNQIESALIRRDILIGVTEKLLRGD